MYIWHPLNEREIGLTVEHFNARKALKVKGLFYQEVLFQWEILFKKKKNILKEQSTYILITWKNFVTKLF